MGSKRSDLLRQFERALGDAREALEATISIADGKGIDVYLVGGAVRDLLLGEPNVDIDLVVEADAPVLASAVAENLAVKAVAHPRFGTAVVRNGRFRLDLAASRTETYERPGALPSVRPAALADDLARRDFSINAMALRLNGSRAGELIDPLGGRGDLERRVLRVLHAGSFQDDATRILRALRYASRLGFRIEPDTLKLLKRHLTCLDAIGGSRLRREIELIARETNVEEAIRQARDLGALKAVHPALRAGAEVLAAVARIAETPAARRDAVLFCLLLSAASSSQVEGCVARLALTGRQSEAARGFFSLRELESSLAGRSLRPSEAARILESAPKPSVEAFALLATKPLAAERARSYLTAWRHMRPRLNGRDVEALGVPHGPGVGAALASLREARVDGRTASRDDEIALVRRRLGGRTLVETHRG